MPIPFLAEILFHGAPDWMPEPWQMLKVGSALGALVAAKMYCSGSSNTAERDMHGRVVIITGGTSGIGAETALHLAQRGAQIILLTHQPPNDPFLAEYVEDMRARTGNQMIYAEQVDLASLHSVRQFATKWIDNAPPRRLDMIILCAATLTPPGGTRRETVEGIEETWMVNYLANFHLLGILSPALRAQPFDRDVRVIIATCPSYIAAPSLKDALGGNSWAPGKAYARSKLALMTFGRAYQKHLDAYKRPDQLPMNARVFLVDPGLSRTAGMTRWLTRGSLWGLLLYLLLYLFSWLLLKSATMGAQSVLYAAMEGSLARGPGGKLIKECMEVDFARKDVDDEGVAKQLWESSDKLIEEAEKASAVRRAQAKKDQEKRQREEKEAEQAKEIESLVGAIKKGKEREREAKKGKGGKSVRFNGQADK